MKLQFVSSLKQWDSLVMPGSYYLWWQSAGMDSPPPLHHSRPRPLCPRPQLSLGSPQACFSHLHDLPRPVITWVFNLSWPSMPTWCTKETCSKLHVRWVAEKRPHLPRLPVLSMADLSPRQAGWDRCPQRSSPEQVQGGRKVPKTTLAQFRLFCPQLALLAIVFTASSRKINLFKIVTDFALGENVWHMQKEGPLYFL